jgi:hypothetical protein
MASSYRTKLVLAVACVAVTGLALMLGIAGSKKSQRTPHGLAAAELAKAKQAAEKQASDTKLPLSAAELKAAIARMHPGMEIPDEVLEEAVDVNKLPLLERRERMRTALSAHQQERWDMEWATQKEEGLAQELEELSNVSPLQLAKIECRTTTCVATVSWVGAELGVAVEEALLSSPLGLGCKPQMLPPEVGHTEATVLFDCAKQRKASDGAVPMVATLSGPIPNHTETAPGSEPGP